jgi:hypothetical protein
MYFHAVLVAKKVFGREVGGDGGSQSRMVGSSSGSNWLTQSRVIVMALLLGERLEYQYDSC